MVLSFLYVVCLFCFVCWLLIELEQKKVSALFGPQIDASNRDHGFVAVNGVTDVNVSAGIASLRNLIPAVMPSTMKLTKTTSCVSLNDGSVWVGAKFLSAGIFMKACTT